MKKVTYRHAVVLFSTDGHHRPDGKKPTPDNSAVRMLALELLDEWGKARGLTRISGLVDDKWDYSRWTGYCVDFCGDMLMEPPEGYGSRLVWCGRHADESVRGHEEYFEIVTNPIPE